MRAPPSRRRPTSLRPPIRSPSIPCWRMPSAAPPPPYSPQRNSLPAVLDKLSPEQYRSIHFNPDAGIWRAEKLPFRLELLRAASQSADRPSRSPPSRTAWPRMWWPRRRCSRWRPRCRRSWEKCRCRCRASASAATSTPIKSGMNFWYSRARATSAPSPRICLYGLSARGLAINTAEPSGEEFPVFTHFWIERPGARANAIVDLRVARKRIDHGRLPVHRAAGSRDADRCGPYAVPAHRNARRRHCTAHLDVSVRRDQPRAPR